MAITCLTQLRCASAALAAAALLITAGCGGDGPAADDAAPVGDPVVAEVGADGGRIDFTSRGIAAALTIPPGAWAGPVTLTVTPLAPAAGGWMRVRIAGPAGVLPVPASLTLTLPAGLAPTPLAAAVGTDAEGTLPLPTRSDPAARTVTVEVQRFADAPAATNRAMAAAPAPAPLEIEALRELPPAQQFAYVEEAFRVHEREQRYATAFRAGAAITAVQMTVELRDATYGAQAEALLGRLHRDACGRLGAALAVDASLPADFGTDGVEAARWRARVVEPAHYWQSIVTRLGAGACPGVDAPAALANLERSFLEASRRQLERPADSMAVHKVALPLAAAKTLAAQDTTLGVPPLRSIVEGELLAPALAPLRTNAWRISGDEAGTLDGVYAAANRVYGPASALARDVHLRWTTLRVESLPTATPPGARQARAAATPAGSSAVLGGGATPESSVTEATLAAWTEGRIRLTGPVRTLTCPLATPERLVVEFEGVPVLERPSAGGSLLGADDTVTLAVPTLLAAAHVVPAQASRHTLQVRRVGSGCNGPLGVEDGVLGTVVLDFTPQALTAGFQGTYTLEQTTCTGEPMPTVSAPITLGLVRASADATTVAVTATYPLTQFPPFNVPYEPPAFDTFVLNVSGNLATVASLTRDWVDGARHGSFALTIDGTRLGGRVQERVEFSGEGGSCASTLATTFTLERR